MRLSLTYQVNRVPINYRPLFVSLIKKSIETGDESAYKIAYEGAKRFTKPFCFSVYFPQLSIKEDVIETGGIVNLNISMLDFGFNFVNPGDVEGVSSEEDRQICLALFNGIRARELKTARFPLGEELKRSHVQLMNEKDPDDFAKGKALFKTMSPIFLSNGEKNGGRAVLHPGVKDPHRDNGNGGNGRRNNVIYDEGIFRKSLAMSLKGCVKDDVAFKPLDMKATVIKHIIGERVPESPPLKFICSSGTFILSGSPEDLFRVYQTGIGFKRNQGFGMLEVE